MCAREFRKFCEQITCQRTEYTILIKTTDRIFTDAYINILLQCSCFHIPHSSNLQTQQGAWSMYTYETNIFTF